MKAITVKPIMMNSAILNEIEYRTAQGQRQLTIAQYLYEYATIGYTFDRSCDTQGIARYMSGGRAGNSYPCLTLYPIQSDDKVSAWNVNARRDANYEAFRMLRNSIFTVSMGRIVEV